MKKLVLGFMLTLTTIGLFAQNITVAGKVTDESGAPLDGVSIKVNGTNKGTQTNNGGAFQISVAPGVTLTFSYVGYNNVEKKVTDVSPFTIKLSKVNANLDDVVVIGYHSVRRKDVMAFYSEIEFPIEKIVDVKM